MDESHEHAKSPKVTANDGGESGSDTVVVDLYDDPLIHKSIRDKLDMK